MTQHRYQVGHVFKRGQHRKVWVARYREDVARDGGVLARVQRSVVLGVADLPTKREALRRLEERLRPINQGLVLPQGTLLFGSFVETQWSVLVLPTLKRSTQRSYRMVLRTHLAPHWEKWPLRNIGRR